MRSVVRFATIGLLGACVSGRPDAAAGEQLPLLRLEARDFAFAAPAEVPAGLARIRLVNRGSAWHEAAIARLPEGATPEAYLAGARAGEPFPVGAVDFGGPGLISAGDSSDVVVALEPGRYVVVCWSDRHVNAGMMAPFVVTVTAPTRAAGDVTTAPPVATGEVQLEDFRFAHAPGTYRRGMNVIRVRNTGQRPHDMTLYRIAPGHTAQEFGAWRRNRQGPPPAEPVGGMVTLAPGREGWVELELPAGQYLVACGTPEKGPEGMQIHAQMGMVELFEIQ